MSSHDYNFGTSPYRTPSRAEEIADLQDDRAGAQRDAALERVRTAVEAAQHLVIGTHGMFGINLVDAKAGLELALQDVASEEQSQS